MNVWPTVLGVVYWLLVAFLIVLIARFVISLIQLFAPRWTPKGPLLLLFELVYSLTDPPLRPLRRILPPIRAGAVLLDVSIWMLFIMVNVAIAVVLRLSLLLV